MSPVISLSFLARESGETVDDFSSSFFLSLYEELSRFGLIIFILVFTDEKQRRASERSRTPQRNDAGLSGRRPSELETSQTTPRERSKSRGESDTQPERNNTARRERSKTPQRKTKDQITQRKVSKTAETQSKQSEKNEKSPRSTTRRPSKQTTSQEKEFPGRKLSKTTACAENENNNISESKSSTLNSLELQQNGQERLPTLRSVELEPNVTEMRVQSPDVEEELAEANDEEAMKVLYQRLLADREETQTKEDSLADKIEAWNSSIGEEAMLDNADMKIEITDYNNDCLRNATVLDFNKAEEDCCNRDVDFEECRVQNGRQSVVHLEIESGELDVIPETGKENHGENVNSKLTDLTESGGIHVGSPHEKFGPSCDSTPDPVCTEDGSAQGLRQRLLDLNLEGSASPRLRKRVVTAPAERPNQKAWESEDDAVLVHSLSNPRDKAKFFDVDQYSKISEGDSDSPSTPEKIESPLDSPRKRSLVQSLISSIELRNKHEMNISPRTKQPISPTRKALERHQDRPADMESNTCVTDQCKAQTSVENVSKNLLVLLCIVPYFTAENTQTMYGEETNLVKKETW